MKLTGKAREDFLEWSKKQKDLVLGIQSGIGGTLYYLNSNVEVLPNRFKNALIIEWFDSVGIEIFPSAGINTNTLKRDGVDFEVIELNGTYNGCALNRTEATEKAIEKANTIYNER